MQKWSPRWNASWHQFLRDFDGFLVPSWEGKAIKNRSKKASKKRCKKEGHQGGPEGVLVDFVELRTVARVWHARGTVAGSQTLLLGFLMIFRRYKRKKKEGKERKGRIKEGKDFIRMVRIWNSTRHAQAQGLARRIQQRSKVATPPPRQDQSK